MRVFSIDRGTRSLNPVDVVCRAGTAGTEDAFQRLTIRCALCECFLSNEHRTLISQHCLYAFELVWYNCYYQKSTYFC